MRNSGKNIVRFAPIIVLTILLFAFSSCDIKDNKVEPGNNFARIYNISQTSGSFDPLDIKQTSDDGFLMLSAADGWETHLMKVDKEGKLIWEKKLPDPYVNPVADLMQIGNDYYFFCMDIFSLGTYLLKVDEAGNVSEAGLYPTTTYPLHGSKVPEGFIIEGYNRDAFATILTKITNSFNEDWSKEYDVQEDMREIITSHASRTIYPLPFFTGHVGNQSSTNYFLNGYQDYNMNLLFVNPSNGDITGRILGYKNKTTLSSLTYLSGTDFAVSRFAFGDNFLVPKTTVSTSGTVLTEKIIGNKYNELLDYSRVRIKKMNIEGKTVVIYACETHSNSIVLLCYDLTTGGLLGSTYLGHTNPYKIGNLTQNTDGSISVLGKTFVAGRYERLCLFKLSYKETKSLAGIE